MIKRLMAVVMLLSVLFSSSSLKAAEYGLPSEIEKGNILHCFSWPMKDIYEELPNIAAAGFGAIQISPLQRPDINEGWTWYTIYLPYDYHVFNSPGMGTKEDLRRLCSEADKYGIKIIVDVVVNHVNKTEPFYNPWFHQEGSNRWRTWGSEGKSIDYNNRWEVTHYPLGDYVELNTENEEVVARAKAYIEELRDLGVKGIRYDAAKHIELPSETKAGYGGIWPAVTSVPLFHYGEIVGNCFNGGDDAIYEYTKYLWVPNNEYSCWGTRENGGIPKFGGGNRDEPTGGHLIYWAESHDDYSNDEWSERLAQGIIDRSYCALACRNTQAALYYSRPRARGKDNIKIEKGSTAYMSKQVVEVNKFRNAMAGKPDYFSSDGDDVCSITRKDGGAVIVVKEGITHVVATNGGGYCPTGTYVDRVGGNTFTVTNDKIEGIVGPTGVAIIYGDNGYKTTPVPATVTITGSELYNVAYSGNFSNGSNYIHYWKDGDSNSGTKWPGVPMKRAKGDDGKYYWCYNVPAGMDHVIFNNGSSLNDGGMQTLDLPKVSNYIMDNGGATIIPVKFTTGSFEPEPAKPSPTSKTVTVEGDYNIAFSGDFEYIHYWGGTENSVWPGVKMEQTEGDNGQTYRCFRVPSGTTNVIFNNGEKEDSKNFKTGDLKYSGAKVMCESGPTEVNVIFTYNGQVIEPEPEPGTVTIVGDYNLAYIGDKENVYYWGGVSDANWPGNKMGTAQGSDGKTYKVFKVSANTQQVIFNTNGNDNKTNDLGYTGAYVMNDDGATGTPVKFILPEPSDLRVYIDGWSNSKNVYCYLYTDGGPENSSWPGVEMSIDQETGYWVYQVPSGFENSSVIVSNGTSQYPGQNETGLSLGNHSKILHINGSKWNNYPDDDYHPGTGKDEETMEPQEINTLWPTDKYCYFYNNVNWTPKVWAWISTSNNTNCGSEKDWPGDPMTSAAGKSFWKATNNSVGLLIFSNNGNNKTSDLKFVNGATYYSDGGHVGGEDFISTFPDNLYLMGNIADHNWDTAYDGAKLTKVDDKGIYVGYNIQLTNSSSNDVYFNLATTTGGKWADVNSKHRYGAPGENTPISVNSPAHVIRYYEGSEAESCESWKAPKGTYDVIVDLYDMTVTLLKSQNAPTVTAQQLAKVQKETAENAIRNFDYITYPAISGKTTGIKVNGDNITVTNNVSVTDDTYHSQSNVLFTEEILITTTFNNTNNYGLEAQTASYGKKQSDGTFRLIKSLENLDEISISSKVNYYYTLKQGVQIKIPMQSPAGSAVVKLGVPEPRLVHSGIEVSKSDRTLPFSYKGISFDAHYNTASAFVEIEEPNITESLENVAGSIYRVLVDGKPMNGTTHASAVISPSYFLTDSFEAPSVELHTYNSGATVSGRWEASSNKTATSVTMSYDKPDVNKCEITFYGIAYEPVSTALRTEDHLFETVKFNLDVKTSGNSITAKNGNNEIKSIDLEHSDRGDWYLVEFFDGDRQVATQIVEGFNGEKQCEVKVDHGKRGEVNAADVLAKKWYDSENLKVYVSTLYPFIAPSASAAGSRRRSAGNAMTSTIVESDADEYEIEPKPNIPTGIEEMGYGPMSEIMQYYTLQGVKVNRPEAPGIYIVRFANGSTRKIIVK